jgi:hypothetical protein
MTRSLSALLKMLSEDPTLAHARRDNELLQLTNERTEHELPSRKKDRTLSAEAMVRSEITLSFRQDPIAHRPIRLNPLPTRAKLRRDIVLPKCTGITTDKVEPNRPNERIEIVEPAVAYCKTEQAEACRVYDRRLTLEPSETKPRRLREDPKRAELRRERELPRVKKS